MWTEKLVEDKKLEIKKVLDDAEKEGGVDHRKTTIQTKIAELESSIDKEDLLSLYIYLVSSLVLHVRLGHLTQQQIKKTITLANNILMSQGIKENTSRLSFLHGDLHSIWSQIEWQKGYHWEAAWHQFLGYQVTRDAHLREQGFQQLTMANRALRLGHIETALEGFDKARDSLQGEWFDKCVINIVRALRLADRIDDSRKELDYYLTEETSRKLTIELKWELLVHEFLKDGDLNPMLKSVKKNQDHYDTSYIIEVCLWAMVHPSKSWMQRIPSLDNLKRKTDLRPKRGDVFFESARAIFDCYDSELPLNRRLTALGDSLAHQNAQLNVDKELLIWAAATRWLHRSRNQYLSKITLKEYNSLCQKLSSGRSNDLLNLDL